MRSTPRKPTTLPASPSPCSAPPTLSLLQEQLLGSINSTSPSGYLTELPAANVSDTLTGSLSIAVGSAAATVINLSSLPSGSQNLAGLASAINSDSIGVTASVLTDSTGSRLSLVSNTAGTAGKLTVNSTVADGTTPLAYNAASDVSGLSALGVSVNTDGTLSLNGDTLNSELNTDYSGVVSFFQNSYSWGTEFSTTLSNLGTSSTTGSLGLALSANSSVESALNANISSEEAIISSQQISLTLELTSANEILQSIPSQLNNVAELYSAITGYQGAHNLAGAQKSGAKPVMATYQEHALDGASPVDLVVALYDGIIRFLYAAIGAVERGDVAGRREAVKRALAILIHLQARLRMDVGGRPAEVLSEFYASMFALILQASLSASSDRFEQVIAHVRDIRDAWREVASDPANDSKGASPALNTQIVKHMAFLAPSTHEISQSARWTA